MSMLQRERRATPTAGTTAFALLYFSTNFLPRARAMRSAVSNPVPRSPFMTRDTCAWLMSAFSEICDWVSLLCSMARRSWSRTGVILQSLSTASTPAATRATCRFCNLFFRQAWRLALHALGTKYYATNPVRSAVSHDGLFLPKLIEGANGQVVIADAPPRSTSLSHPCVCGVSRDGPGDLSSHGHGHSDSPKKGHPKVAGGLVDPDSGLFRIGRKANRAPFAGLDFNYVDGANRVTVSGRNKRDINGLLFRLYSRERNNQRVTVSVRDNFDSETADSRKHFCLSLVCLSFVLPHYTYRYTLGNTFRYIFLIIFLLPSWGEAKQPLIQPAPLIKIEVRIIDSRRWVAVPCVPVVKDGEVTGYELPSGWRYWYDPEGRVEPHFHRDRKSGEGSDTLTVNEACELGGLYW